MANNDTPWGASPRRHEAEHLIAALDRLRTTFRWKADALDAAGLQTRVGASLLTIGGLLKHLAVVEDFVFSTKLSGEPLGTPWVTADWDDEFEWPFTSAADDPPEQLYALWDGAVERSRARLNVALVDGGLDQLVHVSDDKDNRASLRRLVCDLIEEYGRHTGHADLLREAVDGRSARTPRLDGVHYPNQARVVKHDQAGHTAAAPPLRRRGRLADGGPRCVHVLPRRLIRGQRSARAVDQ